MENKSICFAYFGDGNFIGWYSDSFGTITSNKPKIYNYSKGQIKIIQKNFSYKLEKSKISNEDKKKLNEKYFVIGPEEIQGMMLGGQMRDYEKINCCEEVELRIVECPYYDGPNSDHIRKISTKLRKAYYKAYYDWCIEMKLEPGVERGDNFGIALLNNYKRFQKTYSEYDSFKSWIYADYKKVQEWAENIPEEFIEIVKPLEL